MPDEQVKRVEFVHPKIDERRADNYKHILDILSDLDDRIGGIEISIKHINKKFNIEPIKGSKMDFVMKETNETTKTNLT